MHSHPRSSPSLVLSGLPENHKSILDIPYSDIGIIGLGNSFSSDLGPQSELAQLLAFLSSPALRRVVVAEYDIIDIGIISGFKIPSIPRPLLPNLLVQVQVLESVLIQAERSPFQQLASDARTQRSATPCHSRRQRCLSPSCACISRMGFSRRRDVD